MTRKTLADQLGPHEIECIICNEPQPREGARKFHSGLVCTGCQAEVAKRVAEREQTQKQPQRKKA